MQYDEPLEVGSLDPVNLSEYEAAARSRMDAGAFDYVAGGACDEVTLGDNCRAFDRIRLLPRALVDVTTPELTTTVLGRLLAWPVVLAPTAFQTLAHPQGECATAAAAASTDTLMVVSTMAARSLEEVARAGNGPKWFQLYCYRDRAVTRRLIERARDAGYSAICLTVDVPRVGLRERDVRNRFCLPPHGRPRNFEGLVAPEILDDFTAFARYVGNLTDPSLTWDVIAWIRSVSDLPLLLKGILSAEDARLAVEHGVEGIVVSNHGGRQLDGVPATIDVLPGIAEAVDGRADVLLDGGVRRGTDVIKALGLGARAVMIGRPYVWGLAVDGEAGVRHVLELLRDEIELGLSLLGCRRAAEVDRSFVKP